MNPKVNTQQAPSICVIGAGPCGITIAKNLLQQQVTDFVVFEKNLVLGGNWVFDEQNSHASVYETTHIISSKRLSEFEDFPMPDAYPDYPSHQQILHYFNDYADHFQIRPYIRFNTQVERVTQKGEKWLVKYRDSHEQHEQIFEYVLVANGHHWDPLLPTYSGTFAGNLLHAHQYKKAAAFKDQRVLVIGAGNSACDIAVEIARVAKKTAVSIRNSQHIFPKFIFGKPTDVAFSKIAWLPFGIRQQLASIVIRLLQGRYAKYQLKTPNTKPLATHPTINSELLYFIRHGRIFPRQAVTQFSENQVHFADGRQEEFDTVIFATGYKISFPFFDKALIDFGEQETPSLYLKMMCPEYSNLFLIGLFQPQGCIWPLADYQAKIAVSIITGALCKPSNLLAKINKEMRTVHGHFTASPRHVLEVDYHSFRKQLLRELDKQVK